LSTHPGKPGAGRTERILDFLIRGGLVLIFILAPLPFGSVQPWAYSTLELGVALIGILFLYRLFLYPSTRIRLSALFLAPLGLLFLSSAQLVPLSPGILKAISPSTVAFYSSTVPGYSDDTKDVITADNTLLPGKPSIPHPWRPLSQVPSATRSYLLKGIAIVLFFFLMLNSFRTERQIRFLLYILVAVGTFEAFYGLLEYLSGHQHIFSYQKRYYLDAATGTFINRNHFALFLEMSLLAALGLLFSGLRSARAGLSWRERLVGLTDRRASLNLTLVLAIGILVIGLILSYSRAGIVLGLSSAGLFCLLELKRGWSVQKTLLVALVGVAVFIPAYGVGYWTLTGRYAVLTEEFTAPGGRMAVWTKTAGIVRDFPIFGTGVGTFQFIFPRYRDSETAAFYDYAHNDYLQILAEGGLAGGVVMVMGITLVAGLWLRSARRKLPSGTLLSACGFALAAVGMHEVVDFGLQIPANLLTATFLTGCLSILASTAADFESMSSFHG
jgi:O-antigen ligase